MQSASSEKQEYVCSDGGAFSPVQDWSLMLNISGRSEPGSNCSIQGCVVHFGTHRRVLSNYCQIPSELLGFFTIHQAVAFQVCLTLKFKILEIAFRPILTNDYYTNFL